MCERERGVNEMMADVPSKGKHINGWQSNMYYEKE